MMIPIWGLALGAFFFLILGWTLGDAFGKNWPEKPESPTNQPDAAPLGYSSDSVRFRRANTLH